MSLGGVARDLGHEVALGIPGGPLIVAGVLAEQVREWTSEGVILQCRTPQGKPGCSQAAGRTGHPVVEVLVEGGGGGLNGQGGASLQRRWVPKRHVVVHREAERRRERTKPERLPGGKSSRRKSRGASRTGG